MIENLAPAEFNKAFPQYKWTTLKTNQKKHTDIFLSKHRKIKAFEYLKRMEEKMRIATMDPSNKKQLIDPQTNQSFNHKSGLKNSYYKGGILGVAAYIGKINKSIKILYDQAVKLNEEIKNLCE